MMIDAKNLHFKALNERINEAAGEQVVVRNCCGQRYIASGLSGKRLELYGTPGQGGITVQIQRLHTKNQTTI